MSCPWGRTYATAIRGSPAVREPYPCHGAHQRAGNLNPGLWLGLGSRLMIAPGGPRTGELASAGPIQPWLCPEQPTMVPHGPG